MNFKEFLEKTESNFNEKNKKNVLTDIIERKTIMLKDLKYNEKFLRDTKKSVNSLLKDISKIQAIKEKFKNEISIKFISNKVNDTPIFFLKNNGTFYISVSKERLFEMATFLENQGVTNASNFSKDFYAEDNSDKALKKLQLFLRILNEEITKKLNILYKNLKKEVAKEFEKMLRTEETEKIVKKSKISLSNVKDGEKVTLEELFS